MDKISILVIGGGAREHALIRKFGENPMFSDPTGCLYSATGNPGICHDTHGISVDPADMPRLLRFAAGIAAKEGRIITVVGPEAPLASGIVDAFREQGLAIIGPTQDAARIETDKAFALRLMHEHQIPTGRFRAFHNRTVERMADALKFAEFVCQWDGRVVIKPTGLTGGKGVRICTEDWQVDEVIRGFMVERVYGKAGEDVIIMEHLGDGEEFSVFALVDRNGHIAILGAAQDHKRRDDGDQGPNTGGMGAYSPVPFVTEALMAEVRERIIEPLVCALARRGTPYTGFLYAGLMMTERGPKVVEWNCRLGDPETQVILPLLKNDLLELLLAAEAGRLNEVKIEFCPGAAVCVVLASKGYPEKYETGFPISGIEEAEAIDGVSVLHAGTKIRETELVTHGGRVLNVVSRASNLPEAISWAYLAADYIQFQDKYWRTDIGERGLKHLK